MITQQVVNIDDALCIGCGACVAICPQKILYIEKETGICKVTDPGRCDRLRGCEKVCPVEAIRID